MASAGSVNLKRANPFDDGSFVNKGKSKNIVESKIRVSEIFRTDISHPLLLDIAKSMGYDSRGDEGILQGCCVGITSMGNFAILVDEVAQFNQRLLKIKSVYDSFKKSHHDANITNPQITLNETALVLSKDFDVRGFLDGVVFCQSGLNGSCTLGIDGKELSGADLEKTIISYVSSVELEKRGGAEKTFATSFIGDFYELRNYFLKLKSCFDGNQASACINFCLHDHVFSMGYDVNKNVFYFNDSNCLVIKQLSTLDEILETMYREITDQKESLDKFDISKKIIIGLEVVTLKKAIKIPPPDFLDGLTDDQIKEKASYRNKENSSLAAIAAQVGDKPTLKKLIEIDAEVKGMLPIEKAAMFGHLDILKMIVEGPRAKMEKGFYGMTKGLRVAIMSGHFEVVNYLIDHGINIHAREKGYGSNISIAARYGHLSLVQLFLEKKVSFNTIASDQGWSPLHVALYGYSGFNSLQIVKLLIEAGAKIDCETIEGTTPLHIAASYGNSLCLQMLIDAGADINKLDKKGKSPLHRAVYESREDSVRVLLENGANLEFESHNGDSALTLAIKNRNFPIANMLLKAGADINKEDFYGMPPLLKAVTSGDVNAVKFLLELGANKDIVDFQGKSLLSVAIESKNLAMVEFLINSGFDIEQKDLQGCTPFLHAARIGNIDMVRLLIRLKAKILCEDKQGFNALYYATVNKHDHIRRFLLSLRLPAGFVADSLKQITSAL